MSMPTFATLEEWTRSQVQELMQSVLGEEVTHVLGTSSLRAPGPAGCARAATAMDTGSRVRSRTELLFLTLFLRLLQTGGRASTRTKCSSFIASPLSMPVLLK